MPMTHPVPIIAALVMAFAACNSTQAELPSRAEDDTLSQPGQECPPLETREANAPHQEPAFEGQTRACEAESDVAFDVEVVTRGLDEPWAVAPLPGGDLLVTERTGQMRMVTAAGQVGDPLTGLPAVDARGQGGLLDVALGPDFATDRTVFWSYAEPRDGGNGTAVARGTLSQDRRRLEDVQVIFRAMPTYDGRAHFGSRLVFDDQGHLYISTGDRSDRNMREHAQRLDGHMGKVMRINPDGSIPDDNPFVGRDEAEPEIWARGFRNVQAMTFDPEGRLWTIEHGPRGGDELNRVEAGENYGWPVQSYGIEYSGQPLPGASTDPDGYRQPVYYWDPVIAPSGAVWYTGDLFPQWRGSLFVGALRDQRLVRLELEDGRVTGEEHLLTDRGQRIRDVAQGPDGALYMVTDQEDGELWRLVPAG